MSNVIESYRRLTMVLVAIGLVFATSCDSCKDAPEEKPPPPTPDVSVEDEPEDPLKEAREDASEKAEGAVVRLGDRARAVAAEVEAQAKKPSNSTPRPRIAEQKSGNIDPARVEKVFAANQAAMQKCYERVLKKDPVLQGKVRLEVVINDDGSVKAANARGGSMGNAIVQECMERQARSMTFPTPEGGSVTVNKTYAFFPDF